MSSQDVRWIQRSNQFDKAFSQLQEAVGWRDDGSSRGWKLRG